MADPSVPVIMVGPGTGVAPFRAFLHERMATKAPGHNWLFFGHQRRDCDFFYEDELNGMKTSGVLTRLSLAWSLVQGDTRSRELGPIALPLAAFVGWTGLSLLWTGDVRRGAIFLAAFVLPFGLVAIGFARLPWRGRWLTWLWGGLVATALVYALVGGYQ